MKSECHGGGSLLFVLYVNTPTLLPVGLRFHEPGGIHLILPSLFNYNYTGSWTVCQVFSFKSCRHNN